MDLVVPHQVQDRSPRVEESGLRTLASDVFQRLRHDILECRLKPAMRLRFADLR